MSAIDVLDNLEIKPVTCTWVIDQFLDCMRNIRSSKMGSPVTKLSSGAFNLYLTRRGDNDIVISIAARGYVQEFYYVIALINDKGQKWRHQGDHFCLKEQADSFQCKIWCDYFRFEEYGLLPDGKLTVHCEIYELNDPTIQLALNCLESLTREYQSLLDSGDLSDVVLVVGGREFKAHKSILSARSVVFEKMFEHDLEESKSNRVEIIDMSAGVVEELLKFIYTDEVEDLKQPVLELLYAADKYQIDSLISYCEYRLERILSPSTVPMILYFAVQHSLKDLKSKCFYYIIEHWTELQYKDWEMLDTLNPDAVYHYMLFSMYT